MTQPSKINKALVTENIKGQIVRNSEGYYYFIGELFDKVPSIYSYNLNGWSTKQVIEHVKKHI